ncbi:MAG: hypothetical protein EA397_16705 [Deltaproteobacteria bacterium]|nr:MAG: hypothetical protein EA397_16705 [Deltaproteobacteria bacterium]
MTEPSPSPGPLVSRWTLVVVVVLLGGILAGLAFVPWSPPRPEPAVDAAPRPELGLEAWAEDIPPRNPLPDPALQPLADLIRAAWRGEPWSLDRLPEGLEGRGAVYANAREAGLSHGARWGAHAEQGQALIAVIEALRAEVGERPVDTLELNLAHGFTTLDPSAHRAAYTNVHRGLKGIELLGRGEPERIGPTEMLATNRDFKKTVQVWARRNPHAIPEDPSDLIIRQFEADQLLIQLNEPSPAIRMYRGNRVVPLDQVTPSAIAELAQLHTDWMTRSLHPDGRQTYKYWPSSGKESSANNMIRQWMATVALVRAAHRADDEELWQKVDQNIAYNLEQFYEVDGDLGLIVEGGTKVKLGAVALAALAMLEHRDRDRWAETEEALYRTTLHLWRPDGRFKTFYRPDRDDNHNFYPGEALLYWAFRLEAAPDPELLDRFHKSVAHYREWHLSNRNPAFIPWHTQAYVKVWGQTQDPDLAAWTFEMNDWLLEVQQWEEQERFPDTMGRFYDPKRPFGPPHASATGVYIEGLIDAWRLARALDETDRAERYRRAILRALRSIMQLTFKDDVDMFYISQRDRVHGGVRTTVYNNEIRVDNVQHNLMGIQKVLDSMPPEAFQP